VIDKRNLLNVIETHTHDLMVAVDELAHERDTAMSERDRAVTFLRECMRVMTDEQLGKVHDVLTGVDVDEAIRRILEEGS
jgi:hypothetical protein